MHYIK